MVRKHSDGYYMIDGIGSIWYWSFTSLHFTSLLEVLGVPGPASYHQKWLRVLEVLGVLGPASQAESVMD